MPVQQKSNLVSINLASDRKQQEWFDDNCPVKAEDFGQFLCHDAIQRSMFGYVVMSVVSETVGWNNGLAKESL